MVIGDEPANSPDVNSGIPQGSVLGPVLFDIPDIVSSTARIFADDTKIFRKIRNPKGWSKKWQLNSNHGETHQMHLRPRNREYGNTLGEVPLEITRDEKKTWES